MAGPGRGWNAGGWERSPQALGSGDTHGVLECQETVADPAAGGPITADVRESLVKVAVRSTKGDLFNGLIHQQVLGVVGEAEKNVNCLSCIHSTFPQCLSISHSDWGRHRAVTVHSVADPNGMGPPVYHRTSPSPGENPGCNEVGKAEITGGIGEAQELAGAKRRCLTQLGYIWGVESGNAS